jgi:lysyl endopeptidase
MRRNDFVLLATLLFLTCVGDWLRPAPALAQSAEIANSSAAYAPSLKFALAAEAQAALKAQTSRDDVVNLVVLPAPAPDKRQVTRAPKGTPQQIGFARTIPPDDAQQVAAARLRWTSVDGGTVAAFRIASTGAAALRVSLAFQSLPRGAEIRFFSLGPDERVFGPFTVTDIRSLEAQEEVSGAGLFWSPVIEGDTAGVEIFVPAAMQTASVRFTLGEVSHLVASAMDGEALQDKSSGWCEVNVACYSSTWGSTAKAVAKIVFTSGGSSYLCM